MGGYVRKGSRLRLSFFLLFMVILIIPGWLCTCFPEGPWRFAQHLHTFMGLGHHFHSEASGI